MMDSKIKKRVVYGIIIASIGLVLNIYGVSGFPFSPAIDWYIYFALGAGAFLLGVGMIFSGLLEWKRAD